MVMMISRRDVLKIGGSATLFGTIKTTFSPGAHAAEFGASPPTGGIVPGSTVVRTATDMQAALNAGVRDITLDAEIVAPDSGILIPRSSTPYTVRGTIIALIKRTNNVAAPCIRAAGDGPGGRFILDHVRCDGGWRNSRSGDSGSWVPFNFQGCAYVSFRNCVSCYSKNLAFIVDNTTQCEMISCTAFCICYGLVSDDNVRDMLIQDGWFQHGGDDSIQWHQTPDTSLRPCSVILRHNLVRDFFGCKTHCGVGDGTYNCKTSQLLVENNTFEGANRYGWDFNNYPQSGSFHGPPHNSIACGNTIKNLTTDSPSERSGSPDGKGINLFLQSSNTFDATTTIVNNTFIRDTTLQDKKNQDVYTWAQVNGTDKPAWVPGSDAQGGGFWSQSGFNATWTIDLGHQGVVFTGDNAGTVTHSGNKFIGDGWTNTLA